VGELRLGYNYKGRGGLNNLRVPIDRRTYCGKYRPEEVADLFRKSVFGWPVNNARMIYEARDDKYHTFQSKVVVFAPFTRNTKHLREWSRWAELADAVTKKYNLIGLFACLESQYEDAMAIKRKMKRRDHAWVMADTFPALCSTLRSSALCVTVNTATMHLAISQNTPTVAIIGGTPKQVVFPEGNPRFQCVEDPGLGFGIYRPRISEITVNEVMERIDAVWNHSHA
jgi:ADP-heptose:LPS heptosyltransferase